MAGVVTIGIPGLADRLLQDGNYRNDEPDRWARYWATRKTGRVGRGHVAVASLVVGDWRDIAVYLSSIIGVYANMRSDELGADGRSELRAARSAVQRIETACNTD